MGYEKPLLLVGYADGCGEVLIGNPERGLLQQGSPFADGEKLLWKACAG